MSLRGSHGYQWDITKPLGQGATSMVCKGRNKSTGEEVAVKVFSQAGHMRPHNVQMREFEVIKKLKHKNIVPMLAIEEEHSTRKKVIIMQLTEHGSLLNMLEDPKNAYGLPEEEFLFVFEHVTAGMKYMRDSGIVHRDIKPGNILRYIGEDGRSIYKLTDFGAAKQLNHKEEQFMSLYGTEEYLHPDMYERAVLRKPNRRQFTATVDLWSMGVTFFHVATGQLPFKPYGENRQKMFEITRHKESGVIMGVQHSDEGNIKWSKELPKTCRLSDGLKLLITPVFARLLESDPSKVWNFDACFREIDSIVKKKVIHVFSPHKWNSLKVYINSDNILTTLQELIAEQTEIVAPSQLLIFDGQQLKDHVQAMLPISSYPKGITETNPIFVYTKHMNDFARFPVPNIKDFPRFTSSLTTDDYAIAKMCSAIACDILKEVELYCMKQELVRRAVQMYIHELYHELGHLVDYHTFLERNCDSITKWKDNFLRTFKRELTMVGMIVKTGTQLNHILTDLEAFHEQSEMNIGELSVQISALGNEVVSHLVELKDQELQKKVLKKQWNDSVGCISEDRCVAKVEVVLEQILKIKLQFSEDRKRPDLSFNEEQIHEYERNRFSENCTKIKSLFFDHCLAGAKDQYTRYHSWFRLGYDVRQRCEILEKKLLNLADRSDGFVHKLNDLCQQYNTDLKLKMSNVCELLEKEGLGLSGRSEGFFTENSDVKLDNDQETTTDISFESSVTSRQSIIENVDGSDSSSSEEDDVQRQNLIPTVVTRFEMKRSIPVEEKDNKLKKIKFTEKEEKLEEDIFSLTLGSIKTVSIDSDWDHDPDISISAENEKSES